MYVVTSFVENYPGFLFMTLFFMLWPFIRKYALDSHKTDIKLTRSTINAFIRTADTDEYIDLNVEDYDGIVDNTAIFDCLKESSNSNVIMNEIRKDNKKGYNFMILKHRNNGDAIFPHSHNRSNEFVYVMNGKLRILFHNDGKDNDERVDLDVGGSILIKRGRIHSTISLTDETNYIVVAKPPLFDKSNLKAWAKFITKLWRRNDSI